MIRYILEFLFCSGLFMVLYKLFIEGRVAHRLASLYLVAGAILAAVIPTLELPLYPAQTIVYELPVMTIVEEQSVGGQAVTPVVQVDWAYILSWVALGIYLVVFALNIIRFIHKLWLIRCLRRYAQLTVYEAYTLAESEHVEEPFSFWRTIYLNYLFIGREREQVIIHELSHIRHHHTAERLTLELMRCVFWFNPFLWLAANALVEVQEWEADSDVLNQGYSVYEYRQIIFRQLFGCNPDITSGLKSQISKKRFLMMTNFKRGKLSFMRLGAAIPMVGAMILAFGAVRAETEPTVLNTITDPTVPTAQTEQAPVMYNTENKVIISADGSISYNGKVVTMQELEQQLTADRNQIDVLTICADANVQMSVITDVKLAARTSGVLRVNYTSTEGKGVMSVLPPATTEENGIKVIEFSEMTVAKNNLLPVMMNKNGDILTTTPDGKLSKVGLEALKHIVKQFVGNTKRVGDIITKKNSHYSDYWMRTIKRDGIEMYYPESKGIVSIQIAENASADKYLALQIAIREAYAELREELAQSWFKQSYVALGKDEQGCITQVIPIKVSEVEPKVVAHTSQHVPMNAKEYFMDADTGDIPLGTYRSIGFDTKYAWTRVDSKTAEKIGRNIPTFVFKSANELQVITRDDVDFIKAGTYTYQLADGELRLNGSNNYTFPCKIRYIEDNYDLHIGVKSEMYGVKLKKIIVIKSDAV